MGTTAIAWAVILVTLALFKPDGVLHQIFGAYHWRVLEWVLFLLNAWFFITLLK